MLRSNCWSLARSWLPAPAGGVGPIRQGLLGDCFLTLLLHNPIHCTQIQLTAAELQPLPYAGYRKQGGGARRPPGCTGRITAPWSESAHAAGAAHEITHFESSSAPSGFSGTTAPSGSGSPSHGSSSTVTEKLKAHAPIQHSCTALFAGNSHIRTGGFGFSFLHGVLAMACNVASESGPQTAPKIV